jgi:cobalt-zinc-cadmium efflux system membrane fusion protein
VSARKDVEDAARELAAAQAEHDAARAALAAAGAAGGSGGRYVLAAPFAGTVVARDAVAGRSAAPGQVLLEVADLSTLWARLEVPETEATRVRPGQRVSVRLEGVAAAPREGTISRVGSAVDPVSRTVPARVELPNADRSLKAGMFVRASVALTADEETVVVPRDAIQRAEGRALVFVRTSERTFQPLAVSVGEAVGEEVAVTGLSPGAEVVTSGAFLLKTEIMKDSIGAGCCESERPQ